MRKNGVLIGIPMRDSKRYRFAIPNKIWDHKLKPIAFMIFSYLCYLHSNHPADRISSDDIARGVHVTASTAKKYLSVLVSTGLLSADLSLTNSLQCGKNENFFSLPNEIFLLKLPPSAFMVYAYLLLIEDRKTTHLPSQLQHYLYRNRHVQEYCTEKYQRLTGSGTHHCGAKQLF